MTLKDFLISVVDMTREVSKARQKERSLQTTAIVITDTRKLYNYPGLLSEDRSLMYIDKLNKIQIQPVIYEDSEGIARVFMPENYHGYLDPNKIKFIAEAQKKEAYIAWKLPADVAGLQRDALDALKLSHVWATLKVTSRGSMDFNVFDNDLSPRLSSDSFSIMRQVGMLSILRQTPNWKILLIAFACICIGFILGFGVNSLLNILLYLVVRI